jgi:DNA invertase Pin-like site-specific DNA recombinase
MLAAAVARVVEHRRRCCSSAKRTIVAHAALGGKSGRKPVITEEKLKRARGMVGKGLTVREIATRLKVGKTGLYEALRTGTGWSPAA